jgi:glutathione synthase/RimK-type ligase-like ATP-grasp enzyme
MNDGLPAYIGFAGLCRLELAGMAIPTLGPLLEARVAANAANADAMMDIATLSILTLMPENRNAAFAMQARALEIQRVYRIPAARQPAVLRVLSIVAPGDMTAITHLDCLLEGSDVDLLMLYARAGQALPENLPEHDLVFVSIGESAANRPVLEEVMRFTAKSTRPVFNSPERIIELTRDSVSKALRPIPGVAMPIIEPVGRTDLERVARGDVEIAMLLEDGNFPLIARPLDSQGGKDLARLDDRPQLAAYLAVTPSAFFFLSRFVDYSGPDGLYRKYRIVMIDGQPFACHMAISDHWMIHYVNADMDASASKRDEEAHFMASFDEGFGRKHRDALAGIDAAMGLDYYAIDCAETSDGTLLIFEADTAMLVHDMDPPELYPYKGPQMRKLFDAFRRMLEKRR